MLISEVPAFREYWYPVAYSVDVGSEPVPFRIFGEDHVAWRAGDGGTVHAAVDQCPHRSARLSQGWVADGCLVCPYNGWRFDSTGSCVEIPANEPGLAIPARAHVESILCEERYGLVWVCVGIPRAGIPDLVEAEDPEFVMIHELMDTWTASAPRIIDNALDVSHVAWVRRNTVGSAANPRLSDYTVERDGLNITFSVSYTVAVSDQQKINLGIDSDLTERTTHAELVQPLVFRGVLEYHENGLRHVLFKTATPIDDRTTLFCQFIARSDRPSPEVWADIAGVDRAVQDEDRTLLEGIDPNFPIEVTTELHTKSDRMTLGYRRVLAELASETTGVPPDREWARRI